MSHLLTYLLTYLLTHSMEQSLSWEVNWFAASQEIPHIFGTRRFITALTSVRHLSLSWVVYVSHFVRIHILKIETKGKDTCGQHNTVSYLPVCYTL